MSRHRPDLASLLSGVFFLVVGGLAVLDLPGVRLSLGWLWPVALILIGVAVLASVLRRTASNEEDHTV